MRITRRQMIGALLAGGALRLTGKAHAAPRGEHSHEPSAHAGGRGADPAGYRPVVVPNGRTLPFKVINGVKVFHLIARELEHAFAPNLKAQCWGYNGSVNGPVIEAVEGDRVRIYVTNRLPAPTTVHWHGFILPNGMDGVSGLTQKPIPPGETWLYEFPLVQHGTFMYHSHHDTMTQEGLGLTGLFVIHPRRPQGPPVDRDFAIMLHEWRIDAGARRPDPNEMKDFNVLTMKAKVFPHTEPLVVRTGQRVRIRFGNLSAMDHHPIHLHGYEFFETAVDGYRIPAERQVRKVTSLVGVGQTRDIEFVADKPGDWAFHCHMTHHVMNQMGHGLPNMIGVDPAKLARINSLLPGTMIMGQTGMADMTKMDMPLPENSIPMEKGRGAAGLISFGGMANVLKVRDNLRNYEDPGWYRHPKGTAARRAGAHELHRDGIGV